MFVCFVVDVKVVDVAYVCVVVVVFFVADALLVNFVVDRVSDDGGVIVGVVCWFDCVCCSF